MSDKKQGRERKRITIAIPPDVKDPKDMTHEERMEYLAHIDEVEHDYHLRFQELQSSISESLTESLLSSSKLALDLLRDRLDDLAQRIVDREITPEELSQLTDILREVGAFGPPQDENDIQLSLFPEDETRQRQEAEVLAALPQLLSIIPDKHLVANNKLANSLTKDIIDAGEIELDVGRKKGDITTRCILTYEGDNVKLSSRQPFTEYDRQVADAVTSLFEFGDSSHIITAATVYRAMVHATKTETPSPQQIGAVTRSLDKMRFVRVQIDCSEELTRRKLSLNGAQVTGGKIDTYLLALEKLEVAAGGQKVAAYKVIKTPILYDYSRLTKQVFTVPADLLDIRDKTGARVHNTDLRIAIKGYLLRRVSVMKGKTRSDKSNHILYDPIYSMASSNDNMTRLEQQRMREYVALVLDDWIRKGWIKGYVELKEGRKKTGVEITL